MGQPPDEPEDWLPAARAGSREAIGQALESCRRYLLQIAREELDPALQAKGGASDLVQETFLEAQRDFSRFHGSSENELRAWLRQLLLHHLLMFARRYRSTQKRGLNREMPLDVVFGAAGNNGAPAAPQETPSLHAMAREKAESIKRALARLPDDYRQVILWRYQENRSFEEISRFLNRSPNATGKLWARALERLQSELERQA
jgi:RNA polymerase sigma-70 factor (ECF subfamily)